MNKPVGTVFKEPRIRGPEGKRGQEEESGSAWSGKCRVKMSEIEKTPRKVESAVKKVSKVRRGCAFSGVDLGFFLGFPVFFGRQTKISLYFVYQWNVFCIFVKNVAYRVYGPELQLMHTWEWYVICKLLVRRPAGMEERLASVNVFFGSIFFSSLFLIFFLLGQKCDVTSALSPSHPLFS